MEGQPKRRVCIAEIRSEVYFSGIGGALEKTVRQISCRIYRGWSGRGRLGRLETFDKGAGRPHTAGRGRFVRDEYKTLKERDR